MPKVNVKSSASDVRKDSSKYCQNFAAKYVPATKWLPKYTKFQALSDLVAGITLGLTMIPQSIAYAAIAGLTPQVYRKFYYYLKILENINFLVFLLKLYLVKFSKMIIICP